MPVRAQTLTIKTAILYVAAAVLPSIYAQTASSTQPPASYGVDVFLNPLVVHGDKDDPFFAPSASSATKTDTALLDLPQTVNVVPRDLFSLQGARSLEDALLNVAGVSPSVGDGQRDQVYIRGFSAQYDQYLDGVRDEAMYFRDLSNIDRVEVLEGPSAVLYGHGSAGGIVDRISRLPSATALGSLDVTYGSWDQRRAEIDSGGPLGSPAAYLPLRCRRRGFRRLSRSVLPSTISPLPLGRVAGDARHPDSSPIRLSERPPARRPRNSGPGRASRLRLSRRGSERPHRLLLRVAQLLRSGLRACRRRYRDGYARPSV